MLGSGEYQKRINLNNAHISSALEHIPPLGEVTREQFHSYRMEFLRAFVGADRQPDMAIGTRLLAIKRPDYFVCIDSENRKDLGRDIGFAYSTLELEQYWDEVVEPITQTSWWRSDRPQGQSGQLWDGRIAMLDVIYYEP